MIALGAFIEKTKWIRMTSLDESFKKILDERYHSLIPSNIKAIQVGAEFVRNNPTVSVSRVSKTKNPKALA